VTDRDLRQLERASHGDPDAEARLLHARLRAGTLTRARLEVAAYCGDPAARTLVPFAAVPREGLASRRSGTVIPVSYGCTDNWSLELWLQVLPLWPPEASALAALSAARVVLHELGAPCGCGDQDTPDHPLWAHEDWEGVEVRRAVAAGVVWTLCPCDRHLETWRLANVAVTNLYNVPWLPRAVQGGHARADDRGRAVAAAREVGGAAVRGAVRADLLEWALRG